MIDKEHWSIIYKKKEVGEIKNCIFFLRDKHLYPTSVLKSIMARVEANSSNFVADVKCVSDMIRWYLSIRASILKIMSKVFEDYKQ